MNTQPEPMSVRRSHSVCFEPRHVTAPLMLLLGAAALHDLATSPALREAFAS